MESFEPTTEHVGHDQWPLLSRPGRVWCRDCQVEFTPEPERPKYRPVSRPTADEQDPRYREAMIDAGRGHLLP